MPIVSNERRQRGQASVELTAVLPAIAVIVAVGWWAVTAAHEWTVAAGAARSAARAHEVGASSERAATGVLGTRRAAHHQLVEEVGDDGSVTARVTLRIRGPLPGTGRIVVRGPDAKTMPIGAP